MDDKLEGLEFWVSGENPVGLSKKPDSSEDYRQFAKYNDSWVDQLEFANRAESVDIGSLNREDIVGMGTEEDGKYLFVVDSVRKRDKSARGKLIIPPIYSQLMGVGIVIHDVELFGSVPVGSKSLYSGRLIRGMQLETGAPIKNLGPMIYSRDKDTDLALMIPPLSGAEVKRMGELSDAHRSLIHSLLEKNPRRTFPVLDIRLRDWPGKSKGLTQEVIIAALYDGSPHLGAALRPRYWINPTSGGVLKEGNVLSDANNVWGLVDKYAHDYKLEGDNFSIARTGIFAWWGMRLGLSVPEETIDNLKVAGLNIEA